LAREHSESIVAYPSVTHRETGRGIRSQNSQVLRRFDLR
jgi:hypothetical protein